jgi:hypothetical protein
MIESWTNRMLLLLSENGHEIQPRPDTVGAAAKWNRVDFIKTFELRMNRSRGGNPYIQGMLSILDTLRRVSDVHILLTLVDVGRDTLTVITDLDCTRVYGMARFENLRPDDVR